MATEKLYYQDPYMRFFTATIQGNNKDEQGRFYVVLDKTAFYPTGGGQPHDTGKINGVAVLDVEEVEGEIRHYVETPITEKEGQAEVDWQRRFDHMQQHNGQHILSAAFEEFYGYKTVSFHLGNDTCTIDIDVSTLSNEEASYVEEKANAIILENRPIEARWVSKEDIANFPLRKQLAVTDNIRLVIIPDFDYNGCGGTHPNTTGEVSSLTILHWEKNKNFTRVHFVCGTRVRKQLHEKHTIIQDLNDKLNAPQEKLADAAIRLLEQQKSLEKTINGLKMELVKYEEEQLIQQAIHTSNFQLVKKIYQDRPMGELQQLAKNITQNENIVVLLISETDNKIQLVCARGNDVAINMKDVISAILPKINGKGGGSDKIAQGGGEKILSPETLMEEIVASIE